MTFMLRLLLLITGLCLPMWAATEGVAVPVDPRRSDLRDAVETHRNTRPEQQLRREEAWTGRHLTPPELAELREQVRQQWAGHVERRAAAPLQAPQRPGPASVAGEPQGAQAWPTRAQSR